MFGFALPGHRRDVVWRRSVLGFGVALQTLSRVYAPGARRRRQGRSPPWAAGTRIIARNSFPHSPLALQGILRRSQTDSKSLFR